MSKINPNEYSFSSVRIRALESGIVGHDKIGQLLEASGLENALNLLSGWGYILPTASDGTVSSNSEAREEMLASKLEEAYKLVDEVVPEKSAVQLLRFRYDCHNIKSVLKCKHRIVPFDKMLIPLGTVAPDLYVQMLEKHDYSLLPPHMAQAVSEAEAGLAQSGNPQLVDLIVDKACFEDILDKANAIGSSVIVRFIQAQIDLTNLAICLRVIRMGQNDASEALLRSAVLNGGKIEKSFFADALQNGEEWLLEKILYGDYYQFAKQYADSDKSLASFERCSDNYQMDILKEIKFISIGPEIAFAYLEAMEYSIKNIRIVLAGKDAGLTAEVIRERIRSSYV